MRGLQNGDVLRRIHTLFDVGTAAGLTDGELLERYVTRRGEAAELAFAALVERHGPIVYRVCRRMLHDPHDAQDAFQAAFLVLIRNARSIRNRNSVGSWLYGVALRIAADSRAARSRRRAHERSAARPEGRDAVNGDQTEAVLEEVGKLPERFRVPIVLCALEGFTCEEVSRQLGLPIGTVRSRLARGKERLRSQLTRRGLAPSAGIIAAVLHVPTGEVPAALLGSTLRTALAISTGRGVAGTVSAPVSALSAGVLRAMFMSKIKAAFGALLTAGVIVGGAGVLAQQGAAHHGNMTASARGARYEIRVWVDGKPSGEPIIAEVEDGQRISFGTPNEMIQIQRKAKGEAAITGMGLGPSIPGTAAEQALLGARNRRQPGTEGAGRQSDPATEALSKEANGRASATKGSSEGSPNASMMRSMMGGMMGASKKAQDPTRGQEGAAGMMTGNKMGAGGSGGMMEQGKPGTMSSMMSGMSAMQPEKPAEKPGNAAAHQQPGAATGMAAMMGAMGQPGAPGGSPSAEQESRLLEVERKLDEILRRLDDRKSERRR